jgi:GntR family transcriptional regulator
MPLECDVRALRHGADRALHRQLADIIRAQIASRAVAPGESLPSEGDLSRDFGLSKTAVRDALTILVTEGLIEKRAGMASRVAIPPRVQHMATSRYAVELDRLRALDGAEHPPVSAFTEDHDIEWDDYTVAADYQEDVARPRDAIRLRLGVGDPVLRRELIKYVRGRPTQLQTSVMPLVLIAGTPVADPNRQPWPGGTIAELWSVGLVVVGVAEEATARMSTAAEMEALDLRAPGVVFDIERIFYAEPSPDWVTRFAHLLKGEPWSWPRAVEASTVVVPAPGVVLRWETELPPPD